MSSLPVLGRRGSIDRAGIERMGKHEPAVLELGDQPVFACGRHRGPEQGGGRLGERGHPQQTAAGRRWESLDPFTDELAHILRCRQRLSRPGLCRSERARELERKEWIARRAVLDATQRRPGEAALQSPFEQPLRRRQRERTELHSSRPSPVHCCQHVRGVARLASPRGEKQANRMGSRAASDETERACRGRVEPLEVVHCQHDGFFSSQRHHQRQHGREDSTLVGRRTLPAKQRRIKRQALRLGERGKPLRLDLHQEIGESNERESRVRLCRTRHQDPVALLLSECAGGTSRPSSYRSPLLPRPAGQRVRAPPAGRNPARPRDRVHGIEPRPP